jgi:hypothetical protein
VAFLCFYYFFKFYLNYIMVFLWRLCTSKPWLAYQLCTPSIVEKPCSNTSNTSLCKGIRLEHNARSISEDTTFDKLFPQEYWLRYMHTSSKTYTTWNPHIQMILKRYLRGKIGGFCICLSVWTIEWFTDRCKLM